MKKMFLFAIAVSMTVLTTPAQSYMEQAEYISRTENKDRFSEKRQKIISQLKQTIKKYELKLACVAQSPDEKALKQCRDGKLMSTDKDDPED